MSSELLDRFSAINVCQIGVLTATPPFSVAEVTLPQGNLNFSEVITDSAGKHLILRAENPDGRVDELSFIEAEYKGVGFLDSPGGNFWLRSSREQRDFASLLTSKEIRVPKAAYVGEGMQLVEYFPRSYNLASYWEQNKEGSLDCTKKTLDALFSAHSVGVILGDRWGPNELVVGGEKIVFVDFDIGIQGRESREFEMASLIYFISFFAQSNDKNDVSALLNIYRDFLNKVIAYNEHDEVVLFGYIRRYFDYFQKGGQYQWNNSSDCQRFVEGLLEGFA